MFINRIDLDKVRAKLSAPLDYSTEKALTPSKLKEELDSYVVGQTEAKKALAVALSCLLRRNAIPQNAAQRKRPGRNRKSQYFA